MWEQIADGIYGVTFVLGLGAVGLFTWLIVRTDWRAVFSKDNHHVR